MKPIDKVLNPKSFLYFPLLFMLATVAMPTRVLSQSEKINELSKNILKVAPLKLVGIINPGLELSYERITGKFFSTQVMASYLFSSGVWDAKPTVYSGNGGYRLAIEERFYYQKTALTNNYFAVEIDCFDNNYISTNRFGDAHPIWNSSGVSRNYLDTFKVQKSAISFNLKWGSQLVWHHLVLDANFGFGLRHRNVQHEERINPADEMERPRHPNFFYAMDKIGKGWTVSFPFNIKLGWSF